jgi:hypothetical protein
MDSLEYAKAIHPIRSFKMSDLIPPLSQERQSIFYTFFFMIIGGLIIVKLIQSIDPLYRSGDEYFETPKTYVPEKERGKLPRLEEVAEVDYKEPTPNTPSLTTYGDWVNLQKKFRDASEVKGRDDYRQKPLVTDNLRWRIHRWTLWDYLPDLDKAYYCRTTQRDGNDECVPLTRKQYCSVGNLYKNAGDCIRGLGGE